MREKLNHMLALSAKMKKNQVNCTFPPSFLPSCFPFTLLQRVSLLTLKEWGLPSRMTVGLGGTAVFHHGLTTEAFKGRFSANLYINTTFFTSLLAECCLVSLSCFLGWHQVFVLLHIPSRLLCIGRPSIHAVLENPISHYSASQISGLRELTSQRGRPHRRAFLLY